MNEDLPPRVGDRMPTLTEVLELEENPAAGAHGAMPSDGEEPPSSLATPFAANGPAVGAAIGPALDTQALVNEVLAELQPRIDMLFESRLREALAPALSRAAEGLIREARAELGSALHELVDDALKRALQRRGGRP